MSFLERLDRKLRVAVLMGGTSSERPISLSTGKMILNALDADKYEVTAIDTKDILFLAGSAPPSLPPGQQQEEGSYSAAAAPSPLEVKDRGREESAEADLASQTGTLVPGIRLDHHRPDVVFIALHGKGGEDGTVQGMLEMMGLPYTGSGVLASALAMDKAMAKRLFRAEGLPVIDDVQVRREAPLSPSALCKVVQETLGFPVFVKPNAEGSTFGCSLVELPEELSEAVSTALRYDRLAIIEKYVRGTEITVGV